MDDHKLIERKIEIIKKIEEKFNIKKEEAEVIFNSLEKYCEIILQSLNL